MNPTWSGVLNSRGLRIWDSKELPTPNNISDRATITHPSSLHLAISPDVIPDESLSCLVLANNTIFNRKSTIMEENLVLDKDLRLLNGTAYGITKAMAGLGNCDNTSDANKPISIATQAALNALNNGDGAVFSQLRTEIFNTNQLAFSTSTAVTELAAKQDPDFAGIVNIDGLLYTGNLLRYDLQSFPTAYQRGRMIHPNMLEFCISDISRPQTSEIYFSLANDNIYMSKDTRVVKQLDVDGILNASNG